MLYVFQAVPPPIIRSSKLYTQYRVFVELFLLLNAIVSELFHTGHHVKTKHVMLPHHHIATYEYSHF
jgi:hypothetical protein